MSFSCKMESKTVVFLFVLCLFTFSFISTALSSKVCKKGNGNFPKSGSFCRAYYQCKYWKPIEQMCPEDQHFFPAKGYCVWPEEYACPEKRKSKECPTPNGKFPKPGTGCKVYFECCDGEPMEKKCPGDTLFDHVRAKCEWPELYKCIDEIKSKKCPQPNGKFLKPGTGCKMYYECHNGKAKKKECPGDQLFDGNRRKCDWPELVTCAEDSSEEDSGSNEKGRSTTWRTTTKEDSSDDSSVSSEEIPSTPYKSSRTPWPFTVSTTFSSSSTAETTVPTVNTLPTDKGTLSTDSDAITLPTFSSSSPVEVTTSSSNPPFTSSSYPPFTDEEIAKTDEASTAGSTLSSFSLVEVTTSHSYPTFTDEESSETEPSSTVFLTTSTVSPMDITTSSYSPFTDEKSPETDSVTTTLSTASSSSPEEIPTSSSSPSFTNEDKDLKTDLASTTLSTAFNSLPTETTANFSPTDEEDLKTVNLASTTLSTAFNSLPTETTSNFSPTNEEDVKTDDFPSISSSTSSNILLELTTGSSPVTDEDNVKIGDSTLSTTSRRDYSTDSTTISIFCPEPNGYFPHPTDKHKFIGCVGGDPRILTCPSDLVYNHKKKSCEYSKK